MTTTTTTPSESIGTKLTKEIYDEAVQIWKDEGIGLFSTERFTKILRERFNVLDFNRYEHYYGFNRPID